MRGLALLALPVLLLLGCATANQAGANDADEIVQPESTPTVDPIGPNVLLVGCSPNGMLIELLADLDSLVVERREISEVACGMDADRSSVGVHWLSSDGKKVVVEFRDPTDDSSHVGWTDVTTGELFDVTASLSESSTGLSAVRQDFGASFTWDDKFYFTDRNARGVVFVDPATESVVQELALDAGYSYLISPDGTLTERESMRDFMFAAEIPGAPGSKYCAEYNNFPQFYPGDGTAVLQDLTVVGPTTENGGSGCNKTQTLRSLVPETDFAVGRATFDPARSLVYFTANRGQESYLFSVPLDGSSEPQRILDLSDYVDIALRAHAVVYQ